jgi:inhibitor of cysteine peptidase
MPNIEKILNELYLIDPSLKEREGEIRKIIESLLASKPEITIDDNFIGQLRGRLITAKPSIFDIFMKKISFAPAMGLVAVLAILVIAPLIYYSGINLPASNNGNIVYSGDNIIIKDEKGGIVAGFVKFESKEKFDDYLSQASFAYGYSSFGVREETAAFDGESLKNTQNGISLAAPSATGQGAQDSAQRVSKTNVQVAGIDEPDILKTDGQEIYFSPEKRYYNVFEEKAIYPDYPAYQKPETQIIKAFPVADLAKKGKIDKAGDLLLANDMLIVLENQGVFGYDVANPKSPKEKWALNLDSKNQIVQARLYNNKVYLITATRSQKGDSCIIPLLKRDGQEVSISCTDIYHPITPVAVSQTYHVLVINVDSGKTEQTVSFVGTYDSTVYMSKSAIYLGYSYQGDTIKFFYDFFKKNDDLVNKTFIDKLEKLSGYDISQQSKMTELEIIVSDFQNSLDDDESLKFENEMENRMESYYKEHKRDLTKTDIVKIKIDNLKVDAMGMVSGSLLNQFSLDEYQGNLRLATTIGGGFWGFGSSENENDIYVLDNNLKIIGSIKGLGLDERIYSARFVEDKGYLVTFKQTDPFFVLDLSDPKNPQVRGELKIPGYSSYLHPITKDKILGIGKEDSKVKISLFDVSSLADPKEAAKYVLDEYWSDILNTHHAFLLDDKYEIFFLPGNKGGYIFSYHRDELKLLKAVSNIQAKRAVFLNDYLYIVGTDKIVVLDESNWTQVKELTL